MAIKSLLLFGGSGFIGRHLIGLLKDDYRITVISRNPLRASEFLPSEVKLIEYPESAEALSPILEKTDAVINLAGENIGGGRWTSAFKAKILNSRLEAIQLITDAFQQTANKPSLFIQGSATGYYGINPSDAEITEDRPSTRDSFLTDVTLQQEEVAATISDFTRLVLLRTGIVLDRNEGALPQIARPFKMFAGGPVGTGKQWIPWIHIRDEVAAIRFIIENEKLSGAVNLTAPLPIRQKDFAKQLGKALNRPSFMPAPAFGLKLLLGKEKAIDLLLSGLRIVPDKLTKQGFKFEFISLDKALRDIYS